MYTSRVSYKRNCPALVRVCFINIMNGRPWPIVAKHFNRKPEAKNQEDGIRRIPDQVYAIEPHPFEYDII